MKCPNCTMPFVEEKAPKFLCSTCGWLELVGKEWKSTDAPESPAPQESPAPAEPVEQNPAAHEPSPAANEPDPATHEPSPEPKVKKILGGLVTITETEIEE